MPLCIKCGIPIANLEICHACGYVQKSIYMEEKYNLETDDYHLALRFYPTLMVSDFRKFREYAKDIRDKLVTYEGRMALAYLEEN